MNTEQERAFIEWRTNHDPRKYPAERDAFMAGWDAGRAALQAQPAATTTAPSDETGGHRLMEPDHETALALADAPRSLQNYVAALRSAIDAALAEENKA